MQLNFSFKSLLVCVAAVAAACAISAEIPVRTTQIYLEPGLFGGLPAGEVREVFGPPTPADFAWRVAWAGPLAMALSLVALWTVRRFKAVSKPSRRSGQSHFPH